MKVFAFILTLAAALTAQDRLIVISGNEYSGQFTGMNEAVVYFIQEGQSTPAGVPKDRVLQVVLADGTVAFDHADWQPPLVSEVQATAGLEPAATDTTNLQLRQTKALEDAAISIKYIMYIQAAMLALSIVVQAALQ